MWFLISFSYALKGSVRLQIEKNIWCSLTLSRQPHSIQKRKLIQTLSLIKQVTIQKSTGQHGDKQDSRLSAVSNLISCLNSIIMPLLGETTGLFKILQIV